MATTGLKIANDFPGADIGAQINAADAELGADPGVIVILPGTYVMTTQVVLSTDRELRLPIGSIEWAGTNDVEHYGMIVFNDRNSITGYGFNSILIENSTAGEICKLGFMPYNVHNGGSFDPNADGQTDVYFADFQVIRGTATDWVGTTSTIYLGNSHRVTIERVCLNGTTALGIVVGGSSYINGHYASDVSVTNCQFLGVATQSLSCVNGKTVNFSDNIFTRDGVLDGVSGGATFIDMEPNISTDLLENFTIHGNVMDGVGGANCNGIVVNQVDAVLVGPGSVCNNTIRGGTIDGEATSDMSNAIVLSGMRDVIVSGNQVRRIGQCGVGVYGSTRCLISGNNLSYISGGGSPAIFVSIGSTYCRIKGNSINGFDTGTSGPWAIVIWERDGSDHNVFENNHIDGLYPYTGHVSLVGANSRSFDNTYDGLPRVVELPFDSALVSIDAYTLVKPDPSNAGSITPFLSTDSATRPLGVMAVTPGGGDYVAHVVVERGVEVGILSDGTTTIAPGDSIQPSTTVNGRIMKGTTNQIGIAMNDGAATPGVVVLVVLT